MIPRKIHIIWIQGLNAMPEENIALVRSLWNNNPSYKVFLWDNHRISRLLKHLYPDLFHVYDSVKELTGRVSILTSMSDIARYAILRTYGGVYLDMDFRGVKSIDDVLHLYPDSAFIAADNRYKIFETYPALSRIAPFTPIYCACFFACEEDHPVWDQVFSRVRRATSRDEIGKALDIELQKRTDVTLIANNVVATHASCSTNSMISSPSPSSWFPGRQMFVMMSCHPHTTMCVLLIMIMVIITLTYCLVSYVLKAV